jgi:hypothetical protein
MISLCRISDTRTHNPYEEGHDLFRDKEKSNTNHNHLVWDQAQLEQRRYLKMAKAELTKLQKYSFSCFHSLTSYSYLLMLLLLWPLVKGR